MSSRLELHRLLAEKGLQLAGPLASHPEDGGGYIAFVKVAVDQKGKKSPGSRALSQIAAFAAENGYKVSFIVIGGEGSDFNASLKAMLFAKFGEKINNTFSTFINRRTEVWVEPKRQLTQEDKDQVELSIAEFSKLIGFDLINVSFTDSENTPTPTVILKVLRTKSPCNSEQLSSLLIERGFTVPNSIWLSHALDKLRKSGLLVRSKNGEFFLSLNGLSRLGTDKGKKSPDVLRALDFAKRGV